MQSRFLLTRKNLSLNLSMVSLEIMGVVNNRPSSNFLVLRFTDVRRPRVRVNPYNPNRQENVKQEKWRMADYPPMVNCSLHRNFCFE